MFQLTVSLQQILNEIGKFEAKCRNTAMWAFSIVALLIFAVLLFYIEDDLNEYNYLYYLFITYFSILTVVYLATVVLLNSKMRKLEGNFVSEVRSINL